MPHPNDRRYRLLVADVDGTLLDERGAPSARVVAAVRRAEASGLRVALATGRAPLACRTLCSELRLRGPQIFLDGALVADPANGEVVSELPVPAKLAVGVVERARAAGILAEVYTADRVHVSKRTALARAHEAVQRTLFDIDELASLCATETVLKIECLVSDAGQQADMDRIAAETGGSARFSRSTIPALPQVDSVNVVHPDASKCSGFTALLSWHRLSPSQVVSVGDAPGDLPLLEAAGLACAVGNASDDVLYRADRVVASVRDDGVADLIDDLLERR